MRVLVPDGIVLFLAGTRFLLKPLKTALWCGVVQGNKQVTRAAIEFYGKLS